MNTSKYAVQSTNNQTFESVVLSEHDTETEAIKAAEKAAEVAEFDGPAAWIVVNDPAGDEVWNNEGDWRNAVRSPLPKYFVPMNQGDTFDHEAKRGLVVGRGGDGGYWLKFEGEAQLVHKGYDQGNECDTRADARKLVRWAKQPQD